MGLSKSSVIKAKKILSEIIETDCIKELPYGKWDCKDTKIILCYDKKSDGGYENVFINIKDISEDQKEYFNTRKNEIGNSSFLKEPDENNLTALGWF
ncbi:hypothetical protein SAMN04489761_3433 [Tenacibaculum sp. MAR_2009_124]|uniref:hypothetical protein n=1 Tax=Tenacibaculum sp. MAR_2009_124 TaxID=1250059 RepID=UPI00089508F5|nr:hypothetical protein [Tenacibaculum sp. MAR_2009_124]SEC66251.1 hypothetical protein SAMN04489761_3433 [Tenacibaculum sp. MAR_2009_124]